MDLAIEVHKPYCSPVDAGQLQTSPRVEPSIPLPFWNIPLRRRRRRRRRGEEPESSETDRSGV